MPLSVPVYTIGAPEPRPFAANLTVLANYVINGSRSRRDRIIACACLFLSDATQQHSIWCRRVLLETDRFGILTIEADCVLVNDVADLIGQAAGALGERVVERDAELLRRVGDRVGEDDVAVDDDAVAGAGG